MKLIKTAIAMATLLTASLGALAGTSVTSNVPAGKVLFSDDSAERWFDYGCKRDETGAPVPGTGCGVLSVGDVLRGIVTINQISGGSGVKLIGGNTGNNELTGIFQTVVTGVQEIVPGTIANFTFGADASFAEDFGAAEGTVGIFFDDANNDYLREGCLSFAACEATAIGGNRWAEFGIDGGFWVAANAGMNPDVGYTRTATSFMGQFSVGMNFLNNYTGYTWNKVACENAITFIETNVDFCGIGSISATGAGRTDGFNTVYGLYDDVNFTANRIPEPTSIALVGLGLLGLGAAARRSKKQ